MGAVGSCGSGSGSGAGFVFPLIVLRRVLCGGDGPPAARREAVAGDRCSAAGPESVQQTRHRTGPPAPQPRPQHALPEEPAEVRGCSAGSVVRTPRVHLKHSGLEHGAPAEFKVDRKSSCTGFVLG